MKIYLSGGITNVKNYDEVFQAAETLLNTKGMDSKRIYISKSNLEVVNPVKLPHFHDHSWEAYMKECIITLCDCQMIYMLKGWWKSRGARIEWITAKILKIEVEYQ